MNRAQARELWAQAFETEYSDERASLLRLLLVAEPKDIVALAATGRIRFDRDEQPCLFAKSRQENTLFDVVEIQYSMRGKRLRLDGLWTHSQMKLESVPAGIVVEYQTAGGTSYPTGGKHTFLRTHERPERYSPDLAKAIPRLQSYKYWGFTQRCFWTAAESLEEFKDLLTGLNSQNPAVRKAALAPSLSFSHADFSDDARNALIDRSIQPLLAALAATDSQIRLGASEAIRKLAVSGVIATAAVKHLIESDDAGIRKTAFEHTVEMTRDPDEIVSAISRGINDPDRDVRNWACEMLRITGFRLDAKREKQLLRHVSSRMALEQDAELLALMGEWYVAKLPKNAAGMVELCRLGQLNQASVLRGVAVARLGQIGKGNPHVVRVVISNFDQFPLQAADALIAIRLYSPQARTKMAKLFVEKDWAKRWRAVLYFGNAASLSPAISKALTKCLDDKEFTVRDAAQRVVRKLKRKRLL